MKKKKITVELAPFPAHCLEELRKEKKLSAERVISDALEQYYGQMRRDKYHLDYMDTITNKIGESDE